MWWPRWFRPRRGQFTEPPPPAHDDLEQAKAARESATAGFLEAIDHNQEVRDVADRLRTRRRANHFGTALERAMRLR